MNHPAPRSARPVVEIVDVAVARAERSGGSVELHQRVGADGSREQIMRARFDRPPAAPASEEVMDWTPLAIGVAVVALAAALPTGLIVLGAVVLVPLALYLVLRGLR